MEYKNLIVEREEHVGIITMNRPNVLNALNGDLMSEMLMAFEELEGDERIGTIVLKGAGRSFCTGHDLNELGTLPPLERREVIGRSVKIWEYIARMTKPVIAAVHGYATAAGCGLAAACDMIVASEDAKFQTPGVDLGVFCISPMVPLFRSVGMKKSIEMLFTGDIFSAKDAEKIGLVNKVVPDDELIDSALKLANIHALAYGRDLITLASTSEETIEGAIALVEKRSPHWERPK